MADDPDLELVLALQNGDDLALNALMDRHREPLFRFLYRYARNETIARDMAQEAFVKAYFHIKEFRPGPRFSTWLYRIALNLCYDYARSKHGKRALLHEPIPMPGEEGVTANLAGKGCGPAEGVVISEELANVQQAIAELPHDLKAALLLHVVEEHSQKEVAEMLGTTPKSIELRVYRARKLLNVALGIVTENG